MDEKIREQYEEYCFICKNRLGVEPVPFEEWLPMRGWHLV